MKRILTLLWILIFTCGLSAQDNLKQSKKSMPDYDGYVLPEFGKDVKTIESIGPLNAGETLQTEIFRLSHYLTFMATVTDTGTIDSVATGIGLWMGLHKDEAEMVFIKTLKWANTDGTVTESDSITTAGRWWCDMMTTSLPNMPYYQLRLNGLTTHKKTDGVNLHIEAAAETRK